MSSIISLVQSFIANDVNKMVFEPCLLFSSAAAWRGEMRNMVQKIITEIFDCYKVSIYNNVYVFSYVGGVLIYYCTYQPIFHGSRNFEMTGGYGGTTRTSGGAGKTPPQFVSDMKTYAQWLIKIELWSTVTEIKKEQQGSVIALSLPDYDAAM